MTKTTNEKIAELISKKSAELWDGKNAKAILEELADKISEAEEVSQEKEIFRATFQILHHEWRKEILNKSYAGIIEEFRG